MKQPTKNVASPIKEIIGRTKVTRTPPRSTGGTYDSTQVDYAWWSAFGRGKKVGYEIASLFAKPIVEIIVSNVLGKNVDVLLADADDTPNTTYTNDLLKRFMESIKTDFVKVLKDLYKHGDAWVLVNSDGTVQYPSPDTVIPEWNAIDHRKLNKVTINTVFDRLTVQDVYTDVSRVIIFTSTDNKEPIVLSDTLTLNPKEVKRFEFDNVLGMIPIVHFTQGRSGNEVFGHPIYEALLRVFSRYDDLAEKSADGAEIMGNPIPTWEGMENIQETFNFNSVATGETDADGNELREIKFDQLNGIFTGKGGSFKFASPNAGFTTDTRDILKLFFLLILQHLGVPETMLGGEMGQARATSDNQMETFYQMIDGLRLELTGSSGDMLLGTQPSDGILKLAWLWLSYRAMVDRQVVLMPLTIAWQPLSKVDQALVFEKTKYADGTGRLSDETALSLLDIVDDPVGEIEKANAQQLANKDAFDNDIQSALNEPDANADTPQDQGDTDQAQI